jgi:hypothetical protein
MGSWLRQLATLTLAVLIGVVVGRSGRNPVPPYLEPEVDVRAAGLNHRLGPLVLENCTLEQAYAKIAEAGKVKIRVDPRALHELAIDASAPAPRCDLGGRTVRAALDAFHTTEPVTGLDFAVFGDEIVIVSQSAAQETARVVRIYDVRELLRAFVAEYAKRPEWRVDLGDRMRAQGAVVGPNWGNGLVAGAPAPTTVEVLEQLIQLIQETVNADSWRENGGIEGSIREIGGLLFVEQRPARHDDIARILNGLAASIGAPAVPSRTALSR